MTMPTAEALREFLRENTTIVTPGETLIVQVPDHFTPAQCREFQDSMNWADPDGVPYLPFRTVVVPGHGLGVVQPAELKAVLRDSVREEIAAEIKDQAQRAARNPARDLTRWPLL